MLKIIPIEKLVSDINVRNEHDSTIQDLVESIKLNGLIQPISVRKIDGGKYEILAGHRRYEALKRLNEPLVECNIMEDVDSLADVYRIQLAENIQRNNMTPYEYVEMFDKLKKEYNFSNGKLALFLNKSQSWISAQYSAVQILNDKYGDKTKVPKDIAKKSAATVKARHYSDTSDKKVLSGKGFTCILKQHKYQILCTDFEFEQKLQNFLKENGMKI